MRKNLLPASAILAAVFSAGPGCSKSGNEPDLGVQLAPIFDGSIDEQGRLTGRFTFLTYNVAGLPAAISKEHPDRNIPLISPLLNRFDLVVVQEDFAYHDALAREAKHPYRSDPMARPKDGKQTDGLNLFSRLPLSGFDRTEWEKCNGTLTDKNDCLAHKGFTYGVIEVAPGVTFDLYDVHFDAGRSDGDHDARRDQTEQLLAALSKRSAGRSVLIAGDTNMKSDDADLLQRLLGEGGLSDSCRALGCSEPERIDRVLFRNQGNIELVPQTWKVDASFVDGDGRPLSDHEPVVVELSFRAR